MNIKFWLGLGIVAGALSAALPHAHAATVQVLSGGCGTGAPKPGSNLIFTDSSGNVCQGTDPALVVHDPDISSVTIGGTAVYAFSAGHTTKGGWLENPASATVPLCVSQTGPAGTVETGGTSCIAPGQKYTIAPSAGTVSVNSSDSAHSFSGQGYY